MNETGIPTKVKVGSLEVLTSGVVHVGKDTNLFLDYGGLKMEFRFESDGKETRFAGEVQNEVLTWKLFNFSNSLGQGKLEPIRIGALNNRELHVSFFVWSPDAENGLRIINYVLYLGGAVPK